MRNHFFEGLAFAGLVVSFVPNSAQAQEAVAATSAPVTVEGYYRIKWGSEGEFVELYEKNHRPILEEAKARGIITDLRIDVPFTHMAGEERWDLRVTMTYRSASAALVTDPELVAVFDELVAKLKAANPDFDKEEANRFSLLDEHWDVIVLRTN